MIAERLRKAVLQAAMEGKLTNQIFDKSKTIITIDGKRSQIQQNQIPNIIPENWRWFRVKELFEIRNGFTPLRSNKDFWNSKDVPWFTVNDIRKQGPVITYTDQYISNLAVTDNKVVPKNSILLCCTASIGEYALTKIDLTTNQQFNGITIKNKYHEYIDIWFVYYWVQTIKEEMISKAGKTTFPFLSVTKLGDFLIPLPPIEEQKRIIEKLEILLAEIDKLEQDEKALKELEDKFPGKLKNSILQSAMEGKLTNQLSTDSRVSVKTEGKRTQIQQSQIQRSIPVNWVWFSVKELFDIRNGFTPLRSNSDFWSSKDISWFTVSDIRNQGRTITYTDQYISNLAVTENKIIPKNSILLCCTASIGEYALTKIDLTTNQQFNGLTIKDKFLDNINIMFVYYWVQTIREEMINKAGKTTFPFLSVSKLGEFLIPLPPIEEQKRIVEKLDKLFAIDLLNI